MVIKLFTNLLVSVIKNYVYFTVVGNHGNRSSGGSFLLDYDDSYSDKEMKFLAKFITPDDSIFDSFILIGW